MSSSKNNSLLWITSASLVFLIPTDLIGVYGPLSIFKFAVLFLAPITIILGILNGIRVFGDPALSSLSHIIIFTISLLAMNGLITSPYPQEELKLISVFAALIVQLMAFSVALKYLGSQRVGIYICNGFFFISMLILFSIYFDFASYSSSGRLAGIFRSSTTTAFFSTIMLSFSIGCLLMRWIRFRYCISLSLFSLTFLFLSGSRAGLLVPVLLAWTLFMTHLRSIALRLSLTMAMALLLLQFQSNIFLNLGTYLLRIHQEADIPVAKRLGEFAITLSDSLELEDIDLSRDIIKEAAYEEIVSDFPILGRGLETSTELTSIGIKPHNLFLYVLYEMGFLMFLVYTVAFSRLFYISFLTYPEGNSRIISRFIGLIFVANIWTALKTPFFIQSSLYWLIWHLLIFLHFSANSIRKN